VKRDATAPTVAVTGVSDGAVYVLGTEPVPGCTTTDATSGVAQPAALEVSGGPTVGFFTATCAGARDVAGNTRTASERYQVIYRWSGFFAPIVDGVTKRNAGSTVPVKFALGGDQGLGVLDGAPTYRRVSCATHAPIGAPVAAAIKEPGLVYDPASGRYTLAW
jgi:hypothetical protein